MRRFQQYLLVSGLLLIAIIIGLVIIIRHSSKPASPTYNVINDTANGLSFNMSKTLVPISRSELAKLNPGFSYGFRSANDPKAICIIGQDDLKKGGQRPTPKTAVQGLLSEVKKIHPDAKLRNPSVAEKLVAFGQANGVLLDILYGPTKQRFERIEVLAVGQNSQVIAYCESLAKDNLKYYPVFTTFFSSLKLSD